jgi:hypothetical protein
LGVDRPVTRVEFQSWQNLAATVSLTKRHCNYLSR